MITMVDQLFDREYQAGRADLNRGIKALADQLREAIAPIFISMRRIEWDAPWDRGPGQKTQA